MIPKCRRSILFFRQIQIAAPLTNHLTTEAKHHLTNPEARTHEL